MNKTDVAFISILIHMILAIAVTWIAFQLLIGSIALIIISPIFIFYYVVIFAKLYKLIVLRKVK